jgi:hypothetical protein
MQSVIMTWWWQALGAILALGVVVTVIWCIFDASHEVVYVEIEESIEQAAEVDVV